MGGKTSNITVQLILQPCCKYFALFVGRFTVPEVANENIIKCIGDQKFVNHESGRKSRVIEVKNNRNHEYQDSNDFASTPENIVNSNTFLFQ